MRRIAFDARSSTTFRLPPHIRSAVSIEARWADMSSIGNHTLEQRWTSVGFGEMNVTSDGRQLFFEV